MSWTHLSLLWRRFSPLEEKLLAAVRGALAASAQPAFDAQVAAITKVQRAPGWTEIAFYRMRRGKVDWSGVQLFPRLDEIPVAEVRFDVGGVSYRAKLTAIRGHIFDFGITPSPRGVAFSSWDGEPRVRLLSDPEDLRAPAPRETLPDTWIMFLSKPGETSAGWTLHAAEDAYGITLPEGEFFVLAEQRGEAFLLWRAHPKPGGFFLQREHDGAPEPLEADFAHVLRSPPHRGR